MRATYKLGRDVITEFEAQNAGNSISGVQISKHFRGRGGGMPGIGMSHGQGMRLDPRLIVVGNYYLITIDMGKKPVKGVLLLFSVFFTMKPSSEQLIFRGDTNFD